MTRRAISSDRPSAALGPYSQAIVAGSFVFCSGTAGIDPATGAAAAGVEAQTEQALENLAAILYSAGTSMADLLDRRHRRASAGGRLVNPESWSVTVAFR